MSNYKHPRRQALQQADIDEMARLRFTEGVPPKKIAEQFKCTPTCVYNLTGGKKESLNKPGCFDVDAYRRSVVTI